MRSCFCRSENSCRAWRCRSASPFASCSTVRRRGCCLRSNSSRRCFSVASRAARSSFLLNSSIAARCAAASARASSTVGRESFGYSLPRNSRTSLIADLLVVDQLGQAVHVAVAIDQHVRPLAGGEDVAHLLQRADEGARRIAAVPRRRHLRLVLRHRYAAVVLLLLLVERSSAGPGAGPVSCPCNSRRGAGGRDRARTRASRP